MNSATLQTKLVAALAAFAFAVSITPYGYGQCISGVSGTRYTSGDKLDVQNFVPSGPIPERLGFLPSEGLTYTSVRPTKIYPANTFMASAIRGEVVVLDQGTNSMVVASRGLTSQGASTLDISSVTPLPATPFDVFPLESTNWVMLDTSGIEYLLLATPNDPTTQPSSAWSLSTQYSVRVTKNKPIGNVNIGGYNWVIDGSNVLYRASLPVNQGAMHVDPISFASDVSFRSISFDGTNLWVASTTQLMQLDPSTGAVLGSIPTTSRVKTMTFDGTFLWVGTSSGVVKYDPVLMQQVTASSVAIPGSANSIFFDGAWLWSAAGDGSVHRNRACDMADAGTITLPAVPQYMVMTTLGVWVTYFNSPMISLR